MHLHFSYSVVRTRTSVLALGVFLITFGCFFSSPAHAAYPQYLPGAEVTIGDFVYDDDFLATTTAGCTVSVYDPAGSLVVNEASMTATANSWYKHSFTPAETVGVWPSVMTCGSASNGSLVKADKTFEITNNIVSSTSVATLVNANTDAQIASASSSLSATLPGSIWAFSGRTLSSFGTLVADIWASGTRTLTGFGTLASDVWSAATRTLTGATLDSGSLATLSDVTTATSSLASAISASQTAINANTDATITTATSSLASVINANTNAQILTASSSLGATLSALPSAVWNVATTTLTSTGSIGKLIVDNLDVVVSTVSGGGGLTAVDVWTYGTRALTTAALTSGSLATNADINTATSTLTTTLETASSSIAAVVNANTNSATSGITSAVNSNTDATVLAASTSLASGIASGFASVPASVWAYSTRTLSSLGSLASDVWTSATRTLTGAGLDSGSLATLSDVQTASTSLASAIQTKATLTNQQAGWTVQQSNVDSILAGTTYRTKVTVLNYQSAPTTPNATPTITVYDPSRNVVVSGVSMTALSTGVYEYTYSVASGAEQGQWETVASTQVESGKTLTTNDYWQVAGSPAQVLIQSMGSLATPNITANVRITNEGLADYEYHYEWCVVGDIQNPCGGGNDTYYASASKLIDAGDDFDTVLSATVPTEGIYYFKTVVYYGTESSGASRQFTTSLYVPPSTGGGGGSSGGGGGGGGGGSSTTGTCRIADINCDGRVSSVDFSILLAYWKTNGPFTNPRVDINEDSNVNAVDFSILLYHWGSTN